MNHKFEDFNVGDLVRYPGAKLLSDIQYLGLVVKKDDHIIWIKWHHENVLAEYYIEFFEQPNVYDGLEILVASPTK